MRAARLPKKSSHRGSLSQLPDTTDCDVRIEMPVFIHAEMNGYAMFIHIAKVYGLGNKSELLDNWAQAALRCSGYKD
jgi:hypothetical protein